MLDPIFGLILSNYIIKVIKGIVKAIENHC